MNAELVCGGLAWAYRVHNVAQNPAYLKCEKAAREEKKGLWQAPSPVPPGSGVNNLILTYNPVIHFSSPEGVSGE
ncbi:thermonuclease family protein [Citrobacter braakii]